MTTIKNVIENTIADSQFHIHLGNFLDEFYKADEQQQHDMIHDSPLNLTSKVATEHIAYVAATTHKLANDYNLMVPDWVFEKDCYLDGSNPYFAGDVKGNLRLIFLYISPPEFKHRNLFVDENVLQRV